VRFLHDQHQPERAYVCWTSPGFERQVTVHGGARGAAYREVLHSLPAAEREGGGFVSVDWDIAYDSIDMAVLEEHVAAHPEQAAMGPYEIFVAASWRDNFGWEDTGERPGLVWSGQVADRRAPGGWRRIDPARDGSCQSFGLGFVYLPAALIAQADADGILDQVVYPYDDRVFSDWFMRQGLSCAVLWAATPKHLHFDLPSISAAEAVA
jgi:hypothetical protein